MVKRMDKLSRKMAQQALRALDFCSCMDESTSIILREKIEELENVKPGKTTKPAAKKA